MTPAAMTPAARSARKGAVRSAAQPRTTHPRPVRARSAPSVPRRISGPVRARPARPRPVSPGARAAHFIRALPDHPLLDRLVRGRAWIPVLGVMLAGIVAMQVEVLKLNASMGRSIALASSLQMRNELLRTSVSSLSDAQRIERLATRMGMVMPGPTAVDFLRGPASAAQAVAGIHTPDAAMFDSALQASAVQAGAASGTTSSGLASQTSSSATAGSAATTGPATTTPSTTTPVAPAAPPTTTTTAAGTTSTGAIATGTTATGAAATGGTATAPGATSGTSNPGGAAPTG